MLTRPCPSCPFLYDGPFVHSGLKRAPEIVESLRNDQTFVCHKTSHETGDGSNQHCYGAMMTMIACGEPNQWTRIAGRLGDVDESSPEACPMPCFDDLDDWVRAMLFPLGEEER